MTTEPQIVQPDEATPVGWVLVQTERGQDIARFLDAPATDAEIAQIVSELRRS